MKYDCLIVDDEKELADNTSEYLNMFDVKTAVCYSKKECTDFFKSNTTSLVLLDINLKDGSGFEICKEIRKFDDIPILFISARNADDDKIIALTIGGDDYIEKPYSLGVLLAKVRVTLNRFSKNEKIENDDIYDDGNLKIDFINKKVSIKDKKVKLTSLEIKLLIYLVKNKERLVTKQEIFENVWNDQFILDGTLNVHIRKIREQIEKEPNNPKYITTVWKEGYIFNGEE